MSKRKLTWEYKIVPYEIGEKNRLQGFKWKPLQGIEDALSKAGGDGWEVVSVLPSGTWHTGEIGSELLADCLVFLKRPRLVE